MKKVYRAPEIVFESFSLNVSIAADCVVDANAAKGTCGYQMGWDTVIFLANVTNCKEENGGTVIEEPTENDSYCYHNPSEETRLFGS